MSKSSDSGSSAVGLNAEYLAFIWLRNIAPVPVIVTRSAKGRAVVHIHIAPRKVPILAPVMWWRQGPDQRSDLGDIIEGTFDNVHLIPFVPRIGQVVVAQRCVPPEIGRAS